MSVPARTAPRPRGRDAAGQADLVRALACFWHPVCRLADLGAAPDRPTAVTLLGRELAIARLADGQLVALDDRCAHRSTRLSIGTVDGCTVRCAHHGWRWGADGRCVAVPSLGDGPIPARARVGSHATVERYGLVWVRLDPDSSLVVPPCPAWDDTGMTVVSAEPTITPIAAPRRAEDLADPTFVRRLTALGEPPEGATPDVGRADGVVRYAVEGTDDRGVAIRVTVQLTMPATVDVEAVGADGSRRTLWMAVSPLDEQRSRCFWIAGASPAESGAGRDAATSMLDSAMADADIHANVVPPWFPLDAHDEVSVRTDVVSNVYRRWLRELVAEAKRRGAAGAARSLGDVEPVHADRHAHGAAS